MTKQEVKDERSSKEIDPEIKKKQRQKAAELLVNREWKLSPLLMW